MTEPLKFDTFFNRLIKTSQELGDVLDCASDNIRKTEKALQESRFNLEVIFPITYKTSPDTKWFLSWERCEISKSFRIFLVETKEGDELYRKPLLEAKLHARLGVSADFVPFIHHLTLTMSEYMEKTKSMLQEIGMTKDSL